jgi:thiosulfate dehydrogenase
MMVALLLAAQLLIPRSAPIGTAAQRVRDPARDALPQDPALAEQIRQGYRLFMETPKHAPRYTAAALSCGSCHLNGGQKEGAMPLVGIAAVFPEYNRRSGRNFTLEDRIVGCFLRSLNSPGKHGLRDDDHENANPDPGPGAPEVQAIAAYLRWLSAGVTAEETKAWRGNGIAEKARLSPGRLDPRRGRTLYLQKCKVCHGSNGQGLRIGDLKPGPLWGPRSWNDGAGAARTYTLAAFIRHSMPYTAPGTLTDEEAQQIAAYVTSQPRPVFPAKERDFRVEPLPPDAVYYPRRDQKR